MSIKDDYNCLKDFSMWQSNPLYNSNILNVSKKM